MVYSIIILLSVVFIIWGYSRIKKIHRDIEDYAQSVVYQDFSKRYPTSGKRKRRYYKDFNKISEAFHTMALQKDIQQQYLKQILELVDTAILAYNIDSLEVLWMNTNFKELFNIPSLKSLKWLSNRDNAFYNQLINLEKGDTVLKAVAQKGQALLSYCSFFETEGRRYKLIAIHNISSTMEEIEANAWKRLLHVMTHEIMNSIAPVVSLTDTILKNIERSEKDDIEEGLISIKRRSEGLLNFSQTYRDLSKTITLKMERVDLHELGISIYSLMKPSFQQKGVDLELNIVDVDLEVMIDRALIEQAIINLLTNAFHAVLESINPKVEIHIGKEGNQSPFITIIDNGSGIEDDVLDQIYVPFFSTRKGGNGIGLTLTREIVKLHNAKLQLRTIIGEGTAFTIILS